MDGRKWAGARCSSARLVSRRPIDRLPRTDQNSMTAHDQLLEKAKRGGIDIYFEGDSITRRWGATDYPRVARQLEAELLRLERCGLRMGRRHDRRTSCGGSTTANWME